MDTPLVKRAYNLGLKAVPNFLALGEEVIAYYEQHLDELPQALNRGFVIPEPPAKFALLVDLGIIIVPEGDDHETRLTRFKEKQQGGERNRFIASIATSLMPTFRIRAVF